jgi:uncharacterized membrane protein YheB (UPF0754 family)
MVGITIGWPALLSRIDAQIEIKVKAPVEAATKTATKAKKIADDILVRLEDKQENLNQSIGRLGGKFDEMHVRYGAASAQIETVEEHVGEMRQLTAFFKTKVQTNPVSREEISQLEARLATVISETGKLAAAVKMLGSRASDQDTIAASVEKKLKTIGIKLPSGVKSVTDENPRSNATAYVQFAGGKREDIQLISQNLRDVGWTVPSEERLRTAAGKREVRYFHDSDAKIAQLLAEDVNKAITVVGFAPKEVTWNKVSVKNLPAVGILEIWLEIPIRK